jgi:predicted GTPase
VDTAGWLERSGREKGPSSLSIIQSRKNLMRAHVVALVLDGEEVYFLTLIIIGERSLD